MGNWVTAPLQTGAPASDNYSSTICGLDPNSMYEYRAYMVVDGVPYRGNTLQATTFQPLISLPIVLTGNALNVTENSMRICSNIIVSSGSSAIVEYGILYTQNSAFGDDSSMKYENYPLKICKKSFMSSIPLGQEYFLGSTCEITGLAANTGTYYRAFAINQVGCSYGLINTELTHSIGSVPVNLSLQKVSSNSIASSCGTISSNPAIPQSEYVDINLNIVHCIESGGVAKTKIYCKPNSGVTYNEIFNCSTTLSTYTSNKLVKLNYGDAICWSHDTTGGMGSYNTISISSIDSYSSNLYPIINSTNYLDKVESLDGLLM